MTKAGTAVRHQKCTTLSGAIDVVVIEQEDGSLACSPFHVRFGKFSLLRPLEKKVEFMVNDTRQPYSMKLGEGGEAFFVFETTEAIPESLQTSPVLSPAASPQGLPSDPSTAVSSLQEPDFLDLNTSPHVSTKFAVIPASRPIVPRPDGMRSASTDMIPEATSTIELNFSQADTDWLPSQNNPAIRRSASEELLPRPGDIAGYPSSVAKQAVDARQDALRPHDITPSRLRVSERESSPPSLTVEGALLRAKALSEKLSSSNIPTSINEEGDLMLDITGYKSNEEDALRAEIVARKILSEELEGNYDIGALIGADERGNLWIYSSEEAKHAAAQKIGQRGLASAPAIDDAKSDPGYQSDDDEDSARSGTELSRHRAKSDAGYTEITATAQKATSLSPLGPTLNDQPRHYAKTLRLTSDQLKAMNLKSGSNLMSFSVNKATCQAYIHYWKHDVPIVISDIDGTITKSDALGHVLNMIGRDWTHIGVAKLYTDIVANGYNILYLTSRSVGQADTTRAYLNGVAQEGHKLPKGPVILSPDRTIAALRREIYLRKPEVFKMACLRDILNLFSANKNPFYAGFGNRLTDALSYRSVNIPSTRIFTINSNADISLDLLTLNKYRSSYVTMREVVDHFFPPVGLLIAGGGEEYTDFNYWRDTPREILDFTDSDLDDEGMEGKVSLDATTADIDSDAYDDNEIDDDDGTTNDLGESYLSHASTNERDDLIDSIIESIEDLDMLPEKSMEDHTNSEVMTNENEAEVIFHNSGDIHS